MAFCSAPIRPTTLRVVQLCVLGLCFASWGAQLGGVASLQAVCVADLKLPLNEMEPVSNILASMGQLYGALDPRSNTTSPAIVKQALGATIKVLQQLSYRSTTNVFVFTPDHECVMFYRYQWLNAGLQLLVLLVAVGALAYGGNLDNARVALCSFMAVASVLAMENAHTFLNVRDTAPDLTHLRGKVFFAGCVGTVVCNLLLTLLLGIHNGTRTEHVALSSIVTHGEPELHVKTVSGSPDRTSSQYQTESSA